MNPYIFQGECEVLKDLFEQAAQRGLPIQPMLTGWRDGKRLFVSLVRNIIDANDGDKLDAFREMFMLIAAGKCDSALFVADSWFPISEDGEARLESLNVVAWTRGADQGLQRAMTYFRDARDTIYWMATESLAHDSLIEDGDIAQMFREVFMFDDYPLGLAQQSQILVRRGHHVLLEMEDGFYDVLK